MAPRSNPFESFLKNSLKFFPKFHGSVKKGEIFSLDLYLSDAMDRLVRNLVMLDQNCREREYFCGASSNLSFARIGGSPSSIVDANAGEGKNSGYNGVESSNDSMAELIELVRLLPDQRKQLSVQDFLQDMQAEGRRLFEDLDRDKDGRVSLDDLEVVMSKRGLPKRYARELLRSTRRHLFSKSIGWKQFLSLMEQKELAILRAYATLCLSGSGTPQKNEIAASLGIVGVPANEDDTVALMHYLNADNGKSVSYSRFRNFVLLLPSQHLEGGLRNNWPESDSRATNSQPTEPLAQSVLKSALAGGIACSFSAFVMHPVDTVKTCVQASTLSFPELVSKLPEIGLRGLFKGSIPAVLGQFTSHGLRTGLCEASKFVLVKAVPTLPDVQVQSLASFCSTILGTTSRVPCEVLKQRLQAGIFDNVGEAVVVTFRQDGIKGFFRGTVATLCRETPFYVLGMGLYEETKKAVQKLLRRDLEPWEIVVVGAVTGGLASVLTTPFDVIKTRMMTAPQGVQLSMQTAAMTILHEEGPLALFRGAVPRFFWVAPLGAMNFAGYELLRNAMDRTRFLTGKPHRGEKDSKDC